MKKSLLGVIVIVFSIFASFTITQTALAYFIGGNISLIEAPEVALTEAAGFDCNLQGGSTVVIYGPQGMNSYFIPSYVDPVTGYLPSIGQDILAINEGKTTIVCTRDEEKSAGLMYQTTLSLPNITYFGTSAI